MRLLSLCYSTRPWIYFERCWDVKQPRKTKRDDLQEGEVAEVVVAAVVADEEEENGV